MILTHYSAKPLRLNRKKIYQTNRYSGKPEGLWLSDESIKEEGWEAAGKQMFGDEDFAYKSSFKLDLSRVLWLQCFSDMERFTKVWGASPLSTLIPNIYLPNNLKFLSIRWGDLSNHYGGILITPYLWKARHSFLWYYAWDAASACIWDLSLLKRIDVRKENQNEHVRSRKTKNHSTSTHQIRGS